MFNGAPFPALNINPIDMNICMRHLQHPQVHSNHKSNDSLLEHSFPAPLVYLLSHTLTQLSKPVTICDMKGKLSGMVRATPRENKMGNTLKNRYTLRILASYETKKAKICNFWTFMPIIQLMSHLFKYRQNVQKLQIFAISAS